MPVNAARRHGGTPSISVSNEKLRKVLITTINPSTRTFSRGGRDRDGVYQASSDQDLESEQQHPAVTCR
jgi:hypothetical protein